MTYIIVIMTTPNKSKAEKIIRKLLEEHLIACANVLDSVCSFFWWKQKIEQENEALVVMKSSKKLFKKIVQRIQELHCYDVPEILALPILDGSEAYLDWMKNTFDTVN